MAGLKDIDSQWPEVKQINNYMLLMGCLKLLIKGLSFLVVTWTTVVLLGGFVSILQKGDFWSLTVITLIQIIWLGDALSSDQGFAISYSLSAWGEVFKPNLRSSLVGTRNTVSIARRVAALIEVLARVATFVVQILLYMTALVVLLVVLWAFGLLITTGISLWRLIHHRYGNTDGDPSKANMSPALDVLYTLVVAQGAVFLYMLILRYVARNIAEDVAKEYGFEGEDVASVSDYMDEAWGARFAKGRNLVTYAVGLMGCDKSTKEHESGMRILGALLRPSSSKTLKPRMLIKQLIGGSAPSSQTLQELLLQMLNSSGCDARTRECAARIVARVADTIHLDKFPRGIQSISSLLETFEEYNQRALRLNPNLSHIPKEEDYKDMLLQGLHIIWVLAADENNCRVIGEARGLLPKIMAPLTSDLLHQAGLVGRSCVEEGSPNMMHRLTYCHVAWLCVVEGSLKVMRRLTAAPEEAGAKLRRDISINKRAIAAMIRILKCDKCDDLLISTLEILVRLDLDTESRQDFIQMLVDAFTGSETYGIHRASAGEALAMLSSQGGSNATVILQANGDVVDRLAAQLVDSSGLAAQLVHFSGFVARLVHFFDSTTCGTSAAEILENLCIHYTKPDEDELLEKLKQDMTNIVMPKVLRYILPGEEATQNETEGDIPGFFSPLGDIEDQQVNVHNNNSSSSNETLEQRYERKLQAALLSLCVTVWNTFISEDQDLALHFDAFSLLRKLKEMVAGNSDPTASCLRIIKVITTMVIAMMKHRGSYPKQDLENLVEVLCRASSSMNIVDGSTVYASGDESRTEHVRTLASLVHEASGLVRLYEAEELQVMAPPPVRGPI